MKLNSKNTFKKSTLRLIGRVSLIAIGFTSVVNAHSMVAQHGTINFVDNYVFLVLSLPSASFKNIDSDKDGHVSMIEFNNHRKKIMSDVKEKVYLATQKEKLAMEGLLLSPSTSHENDAEHVEQVIITARYSLPTADTKVNFNISLFGDSKVEKIYEITAFNEKLKLSQQLELTPKFASVKVFE